MDKVAILIPCYNEALSIKKVINDCQKYIKDATIYVYDNNSTDDTAKIAFEEGAYMITILPMTQQKSLSKKEQLLDMNINKAREM